MIRRAIPFDTGPIHFVGIGGIGMSGIASVMKNFGYEVSGSDAKESANTERLRGQGIQVAIGHKAENLGKAGVVVISSAIKNGNPEVDAARLRGVPIVKRAEMLAEIMRLKWTVAIGGTHGKTTTTSMIAALLDAGHKDPTIINGGIINAYGANTRMGEGEWMVVEADESDGTFTRLRATAVVVTNMDAEHLDHYGSVEAMNLAYQSFVENIPFYGFAVMCLDHPQVQALAALVRDRRIISYGFNPQADVCAVNVRPSREGSTFDVVARQRGAGPGVTMHDLFLPVAGRHNVQNAIAAIAVARELGVTDSGIRRGLEKFAGVKRRFTTTGYWNDVRVVDDYAHHPEELRVTLRAAREGMAQNSERRIIALFQPHRYSRTRDLFEEFLSVFDDADTVILTEIYAAGEEPLEGVNGEALYGALKKRGHVDVRFVPHKEELTTALLALVQPCDLANKEQVAKLIDEAVKLVALLFSCAGPAARCRAHVGCW